MGEACERGEPSLEVGLTLLFGPDSLFWCRRLVLSPHRLSPIDGIAKVVRGIGVFRKRITGSIGTQILTQTFARARFFVGGLLVFGLMIEAGGGLGGDGGDKRRNNVRRSNKPTSDCSMR